MIKRYIISPSSPCTLWNPHQWGGRLPTLPKPYYLRPPLVSQSAHEPKSSFQSSSYTVCELMLTEFIASSFLTSSYPDFWDNLLPPLSAAHSQAPWVDPPLSFLSRVETQGLYLFYIYHHFLGARILTLTIKFILKTHQFNMSSSYLSPKWFLHVQ